MKSSGRKISPKVRLQVFLSHAGVCSRRGAMEIIKEGRVKVNGTIEQEPSILVGPDDRIECDGKLVKQTNFSYLLLNKPAGYVTTRADKFAEKTVYDLLPAGYKHLVPVGRLDKDTEGLLLFTNDGDLVFKLTHPSHDVDKTYFVRVSGRMDDVKRKRLEAGVTIDGHRTAPAAVSDMRPGQTHTEFLITIHEGRKRQIRLMTETVGHKVVYLKRMTQGPIELGDLKTRHWRLLNENEIAALKKI